MFNGQEVKKIYIRKAAESRYQGDMIVLEYSLLAISAVWATGEWILGMRWQHLRLPKCTLFYNHIFEQTKVLRKCNMEKLFSVIFLVAGASRKPIAHPTFLPLAPIFKTAGARCITQSWTHIPFRGYLYCLFVIFKKVLSATESNSSIKWVACDLYNHYLHPSLSLL